MRMLAAEVSQSGEFRVLAEDRQVTRLGESVFRSGRLSPAAIETACNVLAGMAQEYRKHDVVGVRAVGTSALRDAGNKAEFLQRAGEALGTSVEVISGLEEARLIYLGVHCRSPQNGVAGRTMIIDVGGGSAEIIVGEAGHLLDAFSKKVGAVRLKEVFLKSDPPTKLELAQMEEYIGQRLESVVEKLNVNSYERVIGTSGSAAALVAAVNRISGARRDKVDRAYASFSRVRKFYRDISGRNLDARRKTPGIGPRRAEIIVPGVAVLMHLMREFEVKRLQYSAAGLRDGIIADLARRGVGKEFSRLDSDRRAVVMGMARRYGVDLQHVRKVAQLGAQLFDSAAVLHKLPPFFGRLLEAAAYLYDIGHFVSDTRHHRHSFYLVANSDLPGFTERERQIVAHLCRFHRKSMPTPSHVEFQALDAESKRAVTFLAPLLRLASALDQRHEQHVQSIDCTVLDSQFQVVLHSDPDVKLEQWAGEQVGDVFRQVYDRQLVITRARR